MFEPLIKETHDKIERILSMIKKHTVSITDIRRELEVSVSMLIKGKSGATKTDEPLKLTTGLGLADNFRQRNKDRLENDPSYVKESNILPTDQTVMPGTYILFDILATLADVKNVRDETIKKERLEKQLVILKQQYARDTENKVFTIFKEADELIPELQTALKKLSTIVIPVNYAQKRKQIRETFDALYKACLELIDFRTSVKRTFEIIQDYTAKGKRDLKEYSKLDLYNDAYEYCDVQSLLINKTPYYKRGIKEGILYFVNVPDVIMLDKQWAELRSNLKHLYAKEYYKTIFLPANRKAWRKYNAIYLETLSYINSRLNVQLKFILLLTVLMNIALILTLYPSIPNKIQSWLVFKTNASHSRSLTNGQGQTDDIVKLAEIAKRSNHVQDWKNLASALYEKERFSEAIEPYEQVLKFEPQSVSAIIELGICHLKVRDYGKAIDEFKKAREINPWNVQTYFNAGIAYDTGFKRVDLAIIEYRKAIEIDPKFIPARLNLISCYRTIKNPHAALALAQQTLEIAPNDPNLHYIIGQIMLWDLHRGEDALREFRKALEIDPAYAKAHIQIGNYYDKQKNYPRALEQYRKAISINPNGAEAYVQMGICYEHFGKYALSLDQLRKALSIDQNNVLGHIHMGYCYEMLNKYQPALEHYRRAITINPNDSEARYYAGMLLAYKLKQIPEGTTELETYLALEPDASNADEIRQKIKNLKTQRM
jgi:tetratricopeptide (TPR) repeat protein